MNGVGATIVQVILHQVHSISSQGNVEHYEKTYWMWNGVTMNGEILDHRRADHPSISSKPHKQTVGRSHHIRYFTAWNKCIAGRKKYYPWKCPSHSEVMDDTYLCWGRIGRRIWSSHNASEHSDKVRALKGRRCSMLIQNGSQLALIKQARDELATVTIGWRHLEEGIRLLTNWVKGVKALISLL
jgi:hypothetical protein